MFEDVYRYEVTQILLSNKEGKLPILQLSKEMSTFVWEHDSQNSLMVVYYAGHGIRGSVPGELELAGY